MTYLPRERLPRWPYAGHPAAVRLSDGGEFAAPSQGVPLGVDVDPEDAEGSLRAAGPTGILLYTDGLIEARHKGTLFGQRGVTAVLGELENPSADEVVAALRTRVGEFADDGILADDLCMLAARID